MRLCVCPCPAAAWRHPEILWYKQTALKSDQSTGERRKRRPVAVLQGDDIEDHLRPPARYGTTLRT